MIGSDGTTLAGRWPITSIGTATVPVIRQDGSIFYTSGTGKVWGHDASGNIIDGLAVPCSSPGPGPGAAPDERLMFILVGGRRTPPRPSPRSPSSPLAARMASGWPYRTSASLDGREVLYRLRAATSSHVTAADGTLYIAPWDEDGAQIVALDRRGRVVAGWPYRVPAGSR